MNRPFNILPNIGYKNSQFQVLSEVDNLKIEIWKDDNKVLSIDTNASHATLITNIKSTGKLIAKCEFNDSIYQQEIEVLDAIRLGSSQFKKAFVFDDSDFSFILMKDRLLLYNEKTKALLTENHYSPSEIYKIDKSNYLFVTKVGGFADGIVNLGIYNKESFTIVGELLNEYREIMILPKSNKVWLSKITSRSIHCVELVTEAKNYFRELNKYEGFLDYHIDRENQNIHLNYSNKLIISDLENLHFCFEIPKKPNNAIDNSGNFFEIKQNFIYYENYFCQNLIKIPISFQLNLQKPNFSHLGAELTRIIEIDDFSTKLTEIKDGMINSFPTDQTSFRYTLSENQRVIDRHTLHEIIPTINGVYLLAKEVIREFTAVIFQKNLNDWNSKADVTENYEYSLLFMSANRIDVLIEKAPSLIICKYLGSMLLVSTQNKKILFYGNDKIEFNHENLIELYKINEYSYFFVKQLDRYSVYRSTELKKPILHQVEILNVDLIDKHKIIYYSGKQKYNSNAKYLEAFDLKVFSQIFIDERMLKHSQFQTSSDFYFHEDYAMSSNKVLFNPLNLEVKDAVIGSLEYYSTNLNKIVSYRTNIIYLSVFEPQVGKYKLFEIQIENQSFKESYLTPNGQFLMLQDDSNKYIWFDIENNQTVQFSSGNFLAFRRDGSLIVEDETSRSVKILDPKTFQEITPPNYHYYRFVSPDGKLYAQLTTKAKFINKLNGDEITLNEVVKIRRELDGTVSNTNEQVNVLKNREDIFKLYEKKFEELGIKDSKLINSHVVIKIERYIEIGISGTQVSAQILCAEDLQFYNYSAFSYDNKYFAYVGKPSMNGLIHLFEIDFDEAKSHLTVSDSYLSRYPRYASWVCGFSRKGQFATYDSTPDTYVLNIDERIFKKKTSVMELKQNIYHSKKNIYFTYENWNEIKGKNFLCFSPSGDFLALSEQGYEPRTLGGYGHQESRVVHIAKSQTGEIVNSFTAHGDRIFEDKSKKVIFVAFSEDEKKLMTLSADGVVIIRGLKL